MVQSISAAAAAALLQESQNAVLVDVREGWEVQLAAPKLQFVHMPMHLVTSRFEELDSDAQIVCICHHGARSMQVAQFLARQGFESVFNLQGGIDAWSREVDAGVPRY
jgi:rhodanese-related sulfurtransferase